MKALKRFYGNSGRWYDIGDTISKEDEKTAPKSFVTGDNKPTGKSPDKVSAKVSTKKKSQLQEDKNGAPKDLEDKSK